MDDKFKELGRELLAAYCAYLNNVSIEEGKEMILKRTSHQKGLEDELLEVISEKPSELATIQTEIERRDKQLNEQEELLKDTLTNWLSANDLVIMPKKLVLGKGGEKINNLAQRHEFIEQFYIEDDCGDHHSIEVSISYGTIRSIYTRLVELVAVDAARKTTND